MAVRHSSSLHHALGKAWGVVVHIWYLGFTAFGGPPVHFKIFHDKFVCKLGWLEEHIYQELFAICQAFSGPGSTKMLFCIFFINDRLWTAILAFLIWSLPGALGMYGLSIGVSKIGDSLPPIVYALLSGLNAATVGIIALAAVQLAQKSITDKATRTLVFLGASAGMLYNALWYFPLLMFFAGCVTVVFDYKILHGPVERLAQLVQKRSREDRTNGEAEMGDIQQQIRLDSDGTDGVGKPVALPSTNNIASSSVGSHKISQAPVSNLAVSKPDVENERVAPRVVPEERKLRISWQSGTVIIAIFLLSFTIFMVLRGTLRNPSLLYSLFANMYLAGTIIFGGGPVVIPLLREYVVAEGWVSARDFLIGLAIIQAFPGPNFNFAVYLGSLTAINGGYVSALGALLAYTGIFVPGLVTVYGEMGLWNALREKRWVRSGLRGINAAAVGLIYTAVYRLWQIGYIDQGFQAGKSLGDDPWWVVVTATSYVGGQWFGLNPPTGIVLGAVMGLIRYAVVAR